VSSVWAQTLGGTRLKIAAFPLVDAIVKAAIPKFTQKFPQVQIELISRQYADHHTAMTTALSTSVGLPDVMALEASYVGRFSHGHGLEDLSAPPFGLNDYANRFVPYAFGQTMNQRNERIAVPTDIGPGTMLYRADLLSMAGVSPQDLSASWENYVSAGLRVRRESGAYLIGTVRSLKDILIRVGMKPGEGLYFDADSHANVNSDRFRRAFELAREVRSLGLDARVNAWSNEWAEGFRRGTIATDLTGAWMVGQMSNWVAPSTRGLWRVEQLPERTFVDYGGTFYSIPKRANPATKALAWEFIKMLTLDAGLQLNAFKTQDAFPALVETHNDPFFEEPIAFLGGQKARKLWREAALQIQSPRPHKQAKFAEEVISVALDGVLAKRKSISAALTDAQRLIEKRARR
jgi:multiple sugar transport system substrate-binding protein